MIESSIVGRIVVDVPELLNPDEAATALSVGYATIWRWIRSGKIIPARIGGRTLIPLSEIRRLKGAIQVAPATGTGSQSD